MKNFFEAEKAFRESSWRLHLEIGDYVGEIDEADNPTNGAVKIEAGKWILPAGIFVGEFRNNLPYEGEFKTPGYRTKIKTEGDGSYHLSQRHFESCSVEEFRYRPNGTWERLKKFNRDGDLLENKEIVQKFNPAEIDYEEEILPPIEEIERQFAPAKTAFLELSRKQNESDVLLDDFAASTKLKAVRSALNSRDLLFGDTMFQELICINSEKIQRHRATMNQGILAMRKDSEFLTESHQQKFGNCREYAAQSQEIAIENGLPQTFILFGRPDHAFSVAVENGEVILIDGWIGDVICDFSPHKFYSNKALHPVFDIIIHKDTWKTLDATDESVKAATAILERRILEMNEARFNPEIQEIVTQKVAEKIEHLVPNDDNYHARTLEWKHIIDHFGLPLELFEKIQNDYITKFDPRGFISGNEAYVIYDLFCRDSVNPSEKFSEMRGEFLLKIYDAEIDLSQGRGKALIDGFETILTRELGNETRSKTWAERISDEARDSNSTHIHK